MLAVLGVSRSGYYAWLNPQPSACQKRKEQVKKKIRILYHVSKENYGAPKITKELRKDGEIIAQRTVGNYMRQESIRAQWVKPWTVTTKPTDFSSKLQTILEEDFNPERPNAIWCTDIRYVWTGTGFVYLTSVMDFFSRKIIAWNVTDTLEVSCVVDTVKKAKKGRHIFLPLVLHSDRGSQYISKEYQRVTADIQLSCLAKAAPWENACIESFHALIKREWLNRFTLKNFTHAYHMIFEYIETFYNTVRIHSYCNYLSPNEFETVYEQAEKRKCRLIS
ncbi:IS3 family transposase [Enterococcus sp. BWT-B8]|uniref:IS3 family transposase n=1 Tax=Enterococcus sp. BWT-B8 TaxID=2885157 RepID=UPI001E585825|nr:IS3 family transposase [Enterococcus sp. BWT-B8]MCB5950931.1 IS3 family transposase [Enterococcus sp. BWT-B8]